MNTTICVCLWVIFAVNDNMQVPLNPSNTDMYLKQWVCFDGNMWIVLCCK